MNYDGLKFGECGKHPGNNSVSCPVCATEKIKKITHGIQIYPATAFKFEVGHRVKKVGGSYQAEGTIMAAFPAKDGSPRYVFMFDNPDGLLHIFNEKQLDKLNDG